MIWFSVEMGTSNGMICVGINLMISQKSSNPSGFVSHIVIVVVASIGLFAWLWWLCVISWYGIDLNWCVLSLSEKSWITKHALWTNVSLFRSFFTICIDRLQTINYHKSVHIESNIICSHKKKIGVFFSFFSLSLSLFSSHFVCVRVSCVFCVCIFHLVSQMCDHHHHNLIWFEMKCRRSIENNSTAKPHLQMCQFVEIYKSNFCL